MRSRSPRTLMPSMPPRARKRMQGTRDAWTSPASRARRTCAACSRPMACILPVRSIRAGWKRLRRWRVKRCNGREAAIPESLARPAHVRESSGSPAETTGVEERTFLRRGGPAQYGVAMRKTAEAADDVVVDACPVVGVLARQRTMQEQRTLLVGQVFRMFERQIEERPQARFDLCIKPGLQRTPCIRARKSVGRISMCAAAEHVARNLVEQDQQGQSALRILHPVLEFAPRRGVVRLQKA